MTVATRMERCPGGYEAMTLRGFTLPRFLVAGAKRRALRDQRDRAIGRANRVTRAV